MNHLDYKTIELFALGSKNVESRSDEIQSHLKECPGCSALYQEMIRYYDGVGRKQEERSVSASRAFTLQSMIMKVPPYDVRSTLNEIPRTVPAQVVLFIIRHPVVSSAALVGLLLAALLAFLPKSEPSDSNPSFARAKDEYLIVYNKNGQELWKKHIGLGYDFEKATDRVHKDELLRILNADGKDENEVIAIFGWSEPSLGNTVICFNADGTEKWRYEFHRQKTFDGETFSDNYRFLIMMADDFDGDGRSEVIAVARHQPFWPTAIVRLDATEGSLLGEYWHSGWIHAVGHYDTDGDGIKELFFVGESNTLDAACLIILDPSNIEGNSPSKQGFFPKDAKAGTEKYYVIFPHSDLETLYYHPRNIAFYLDISSDGLIDVGCEERLPSGEAYTIYYEFDTSLRVTKVVPSDEFVGFHRRMEAEGKLSKTITDQYLTELRNAVRYWNGHTFVQKPTMNERYLEVARK